MAKVYAKYQEKLMASNALDFDDLIMAVVRMFQKHPEVRSASIRSALTISWWTSIRIPTGPSMSCSHLGPAYGQHLRGGR